MIGDVKFPDVDGYRHELNHLGLLSIWMVCGTPSRGMMCSKNT